MNTVADGEHYLDIKAELRTALAEGKPVVALESTIISHGMPWQDNLECAETCERIVREHGAVPATIAIRGGRLKIGLERDDLEYLAQAKNVMKCSRRDLGYAVAKKLDGATTVAATMILAKLGGIRFFATGGVGGVHRGAESSMDISADLTELQITPVCVVSAGIKSILDIGRTLEYLETLGVPAAAWGQDRFPAFYTSDSGFDAPFRLDNPGEAAAMLRAHWELGLGSGAIIANPIPPEHAAKPEVINAAIEEALRRADRAGITGKETTPFLLDAVKELTGGESLESNKRLVYNNAALAADIARAYAASA